MLYVIAACVYLSWLLASLNGDVRWLSWPFALANVVSVAATLLNNRDLMHSLPDAGVLT